MRNLESENAPTPSPLSSGFGEEKPAEEAAADTASGVTEDEPLLGAYESGSEPSAPIFVEVITEEPVEYLAPERPISTGDLIPQAVPIESPTPEGEPTGAPWSSPEDDSSRPKGHPAHRRPLGVDTLPYPIISEEPQVDEDLIPDPIMEETDQSYPSLRPSFAGSGPSASDEPDSSQAHRRTERTYRPPFGTTAPLGPKPDQKGTDSDSGD